MNKTFNPADYQEFTFLEFKQIVNVDCFELILRYQLDELTFEERLSFPAIKPERLELAGVSEAVQRACSLIHYLFGVSYYKAAVPQQINFAENLPPQEVLSFIKETWFFGLQEFAYLNKIDLRKKISFPDSDSSLDNLNRAELILSERAILPLGGGKDSCLLYRILEQEDPLLLSLGHNPQVSALALRENKKLIEISRNLDPQLLALNKAGAFNGHVPFSALLGSVCAISAILYDTRYIVLANERSASEANTSYLGSEVNHQYSKSFEFEKKLNQVIKAYISPEIEYFSMFRSFSELRIVKDFSKYKKDLNNFSSCNQVKKFTKNGQENWCCSCSKCCFVFLLFAVYLPLSELVKLFGKNLFEQQECHNFFRELCGISGIKPFECVGEYQESLTAFKFLKTAKDYQDFGIVQEINQYISSQELDLKSIAEYEQLNGDNIIPSVFQRHIQG